MTKLSDDRTLLVRLSGWLEAWRRVARDSEGQTSYSFELTDFLIAPEVFLCASCRLRTRKGVSARPRPQ